MFVSIAFVFQNLLNSLTTPAVVAGKTREKRFSTLNWKRYQNITAQLICIKQVFPNKNWNNLFSFSLLTIIILFNNQSVVIYCGNKLCVIYCAAKIHKTKCSGNFVITEQTKDRFKLALFFFFFQQKSILTNWLANNYEFGQFPQNCVLPKHFIKRPYYLKAQYYL